MSVYSTSDRLLTRDDFDSALEVLSRSQLGVRRTPCVAVKKAGGLNRYLRTFYTLALSSSKVVVVHLLKNDLPVGKLKYGVWSLHT